MRTFIAQFMTDGKLEYKKLLEHRTKQELPALTEEPDNETYTKEVEAAKEKDKGEGKKADVAKPAVDAVKVEMFDANEVNGIATANINEENAADEAKKMGLIYKGYGRYASKNDPDHISHVSKDGKIVKREMSQADQHAVDK